MWQKAKQKKKKTLNLLWGTNRLDEEKSEALGQTCGYLSPANFNLFLKMPQLNIEKTKGGKFNIMIYDEELKIRFRMAQFNDEKTAKKFVAEYENINETIPFKPRSKDNNVWKKIKKKIR